MNKREGQRCWAWVPASCAPAQVLGRSGGHSRAQVPAAQQAESSGVQWSSLSLTLPWPVQVVAGTLGMNPNKDALFVFHLNKWRINKPRSRGERGGEGDRERQNPHCKARCSISPNHQDRKWKQWFHLVLSMVEWGKQKTKTEPLS